MGKPLKLDYVWAALCILGAVYFGVPFAGRPMKNEVLAEPQTAIHAQVNRCPGGDAIRA